MPQQFSNLGWNPGPVYPKRGRTQRQSLLLKTLLIMEYVLTHLMPDRAA